MADDIRAKRAERARQEKLKSMPKQAARYLAIGAVVVLLATGVFWFSTHQPPPKKFVHEHAAFQWYIDGQPISFRDTAYDCQVAQICDVVHMHAVGSEGDRTDVLHVEGMYPGGVPDWGLGKIFSQYGLTIGPTDVKLDSKGGHNGTEWRDQGNATWTAWVSKATVDGRQPFQQVQGDWTAYIPRDQDKVLITYGNASNTTELQREEQGIPDASEWTGGGPTMPGG